jgi:hypothetical protein
MAPPSLPEASARNYGRPEGLTPGPQGAALGAAVDLPEIALVVSQLSGELSSGPDAELAVGVAEVELHGVDRDDQRARDLLVGESLGGQSCDPLLGRRQPTR